MSSVQRKVFEYPEEKIPYIGGTDYLIDALIDAEGGKAFLNKKIVKIHDKAVYTENGDVIEFDYLINTIPLVYLMDYMGTPVNLKYQPIRFMNIHMGCARDVRLVDNEMISPMYIYFPGLSIPFHRMSFPHRFRTKGGGIGEVLIETMTEERESNPEILNFLEKIGLIDVTDELLVEEFTQFIGHFHYEGWAGDIVKELEDFDVYCLGRYGEWSHNSNIGTVIERIKHIIKTIREHNGPRSQP
jgi:hypothetical protein